MIRIILVLCLLLLPAAAARAEPPSAADQAEFQRIITAQIGAFRADDGAGAYSFAAPMIRQIFPTPETFMDMVRKGYQPVYRPQSYRFGVSGENNVGQPMQRVLITGPDGKGWEAVYTFERQPDGSWKINGCYLKELSGLDA